VKALVFERNLPRFAAARVASAVVGSGKGVRVGPLELAEVDAQELPGPGWVRVRPRLAGICGSDLATLDGRSSRYFEQLVSFPFVPGHEIVGDVEGGRFDGRRVVVEPVLGCEARGIDPRCPGCASGRKGSCERIAFGHIRPGLQTGYCRDTGGGWSMGLVAHESQLHEVPDDLSDEAAVMVEPAACAVHAACAADIAGGERVMVLGAGTLGLCVIAALRELFLPGALVAIAKHPEQRRLARELGADQVASPEERKRAARRLSGSLALESHGGKIERLTGGVDLVVDCVGSSDSLQQCLDVVRPGGKIVLVGMPGVVRVDLAPLWQREIELRGAYAYGLEERPEGPRSTFDIALELVRDARLERLVSARYPLERYEDAVAHAAAAGRRGAVKIVFDLRKAPARSVAAASSVAAAGAHPRPRPARTTKEAK
jgi:threonine dehydrogenase-like Zn-dependent dehydrogenase